jgi:DHA1 family tetracycline resistance protein-like MFS transporter
VKLLKNIDRRLFTILMIVFVQMLGSSMVIPILPLFAQREFDLSPQMISLLFTSFFLAQFIAGPYLGRLSDRQGRLPILIISQIGTVISFVMIGFAQSAAVLFLARVVDGITGGNIIVAQAYVTDVTSPRKRTEALGYILAVFGLGFIVGPSLGGFLAGFFGPRVPFYLAAGVATLTVLLTWWALDESLSPEQRENNRSFRRNTLAPSAVLRNSPLLLVLGIVFIAQLGLGLLQSTFALFGEAVLFAGRDERTVNIGIGLLLGTVGLTQFLTQSLFLRFLLSRFSETALVIIGNLLRVMGALFYSLASSVMFGVFGSIVFPLGLGIMMPSLQSMATRSVDDELRGGVLGVYQSAISLSIIIGTATGGLLFSISPWLPYWVSAGMGALALIPAFVLWQRNRDGLLFRDPLPTSR